MTPSTKKKTPARDTSKVVNDTLADTASAWKSQGTWSQVKGKARRLWGHLTDDDLNVAEGSYEELMGRIHTKSGEALDSIRSKLFQE